MSIQFQDRKEALFSNKTFASAMAELYEAHCSPSLFSPGEKFSNEGKLEILTAETCKSLNEEVMAFYREHKDNVPVKNLDWVCKRILLPVPDVPADKGIEMAAKSLDSLSSILKLNSWTFLTQGKGKWLAQENSFHKVVTAQRWLRDQGVDERFTEAITASGTQLQELVTHLLWLTRCNASMREIYLTGNQANGEEMKLIGCLCKYGNIHWDFFSEEQYRSFSDAVENLSDIQLSETCDFPSVAIAGREISL